MAKKKIKKVTKKSPDERLKWIGIGFLTILIIATGIFLLNKTESARTLLPGKPQLTNTLLQKSNWKTYQGNGFSFQYPAEWTEKKLTDTIILTKPASPFHSTSGISTTVYGNSGNLSAQNFLRQKYYNIPSDNNPANQNLYSIWLKADMKNAIPISVAGKLGVKFNHLVEGSGNLGPFILLSLGKDSLLIQLYGSDSELDKLYQQILSTFKFTN